MRTVRAVVMDDARCEPVILITKDDAIYAPLTRKQFSARLTTGELILHSDLSKLLRALARRAEKGTLTA